MVCPDIPLGLVWNQFTNRMLIRKFSICKNAPASFLPILEMGKIFISEPNNYQ